MADNDSEEDDYMSDAFLQQLGDARPGLVPHKVAKQYEREKKQRDVISQHRQQNKPRAALEHEKREEGLKETLGSDNKGFALLQKMGYKPGMAIGKTGSGRKDPVPINIKLGRGGLGRESDQKRKQDARQQMRASMMAKRQKLETRQRSEFVQRMGGRVVERKVEGDLRKSQKVCEQLDAEADVKKPAESFFWPAEFLPQKKKLLSEKLTDVSEGLSGGYDAVLDDDDEEDDEGEDDIEEEEEPLPYTSGEMLDLVTCYLRETYKYCIWCGTRFDDDKDLESNCPGNTAAAHDD